ncbi:MAG: spore germination protein [Clostridiales bacterium]|jgi:spore germination protein KA|nr:spore germination protein [Clostridiales bacterium]
MADYLTTLTTDMAANKEAILARMSYGADLVERTFKIGGKLDAALFYMSGMTDAAQIQDAVLIPLAAQSDWKLNNKSRGKMKAVLERLPAAEVKTETEMDEIAGALVSGDAILLLAGEKACIRCAFKKWDKRAVAEPPNSAVVRGPREGFVEDMKTNTTLIRRRLRSEHLIMTQMTVGRFSNTPVTVAHVRGIADEKLVEKIAERIKGIDIDGVIDSFYIQQFLEERRSGLFKQIGWCEKPDIAAAKLLEGRVAVFVDGSPAVLTLPYLFFEDVQSSADAYTRQAYNYMILTVRLLALALAVLLPGVYVAAQVFHYNLLPIKMFISLSDAVQRTPLPPALEMLFVLFLFTAVYEAALRMPRYVGMALSIVAALVLGETAVRAGILSSFSVLISAVSALAVQTVPDQAESANVLKLFFVAAGGLAGFFGIVLGVLFVGLYVLTLDSYGAPYFAPYAPYIRNDVKDGIFRTNIAGMKTRPESIPNVNRVRQGK